MTARGFLQELINLQERVDELEEEYEIQQAKATQTTRRHKAVLVKNSRDLKKQEEIMAAMADLSIEIDNELMQLFNMRRKARKTIGCIEDPRYRQILTLRYLRGMRLRKIADRMSYSEVHIKRLHKDAISALEKKMIPNDTF